MENLSLDPAIESNPILTDLSDLSARAADAGTERPLGEPKAPKGKRGRPPGSGKSAKSKTPHGSSADPSASASAPDTEAPQAPDPAIIMLSQQLMGVISSAMVKYTGVADAAMSHDELQGMTMASAAVFQKYMPNLLSQYSAEFMLLTVAGMYGMRVAMVTSSEIEARMAEQKRRESKATQDISAAQEPAPLEKHFPQLMNN